MIFAREKRSIGRNFLFRAGGLRGPLQGVSGGLGRAALGADSEIIVRTTRTRNVRGDLDLDLGLVVHGLSQRARPGRHW